jgi:uncharacterized protein
VRSGLNTQAPSNTSMRLINQTKNIILAEDVLMARTPFRRIKGLLGRKVFLSGQAIILEPCNSVHTFFMCFPIDILFVDKNYKIIKILPKFNPNRISRIYWHSSRVIELPAGKLDITNTQAKDQLQLSDQETRG